MSTENNIKKRLYDIETPPPLGMWDTIAARLDEEDATKSLVPVYVMPKRTNWLKIALAASFLGFAAMTTLWLTKDSNKVIEKQDDTITKTNTVVIKDTVYLPNNNVVNSVKDKVIVQSNNVTTPTPTETNIIPNKELIIKDNNNTQKKDNELVTINPNNSKKVNDLPQLTIKDQNGNPIKDINVVKATDPNSVAGPDSKGDKAIGNVINKISLKSDKEEIDSIINNSIFWKKQINEWRKILIKSGYTPSSVNFLDIIELKKLIEKK